MKTYFKAWVKFFRFWYEYAKYRIDWSGDAENKRIKAQAVKNVDAYHAYVRETYTPTEFEKFVSGCKHVQIEDKTAEEVFAERKKMIEGGHVTYSDWNKYRK